MCSRLESDTQLRTTSSSLQTIRVVCWNQPWNQLWTNPATKHGSMPGNGQTVIFQGEVLTAVTAAASFSEKWSMAMMRSITVPPVILHAPLQLQEQRPTPSR